MKIIDHARQARFLPQTRMGDPDLCVSATAATSIKVRQDDLFHWFTRLDISRVLNGYGPLPAVHRTIEQSGDWSAPGQTRKLEMSGNITARQEVLVCERPAFFAYRVTEFTHMLDKLAWGAEARWWFDPLDDAATHMRWTYTFWPRSFAGKLALYPVIKTIWSWYMQRAIQEMKHLAERETGS